MLRRESAHTDANGHPTKSQLEDHGSKMYSKAFALLQNWIQNVLDIYKPELKRNRSMLTLLFQSLAIAAIPYGEGSALLSAIYGGGPLSIFVGWIVVCVLDQCIAMSLAELASRYPTSAGPYYWSFQIAQRGKTVLSFITGWTWLIGKSNDMLIRALN